MSNLTCQNLIKCIIQKDKYKQTLHYIKEVQLQNDAIYSVINQAIYKIIITNQYPPSAKLFALRFFKELFLTAQFQFIDGMHQSIFKHIVKACQFDKDNKQTSKRGVSYFEQVQKRKKENDLQKISFSFVLFCTQMIYVMGKWYAQDENQQKTDYSVIYQKLKKSGVPFPTNDKQLKFFKPQQRQVFSKNFKQWVEKLPQIQELSQQGDEKQNIQFKSKKSIKSKQNIHESKAQHSNQQSASKDRQLKIKKQTKQNSSVAILNENLQIKQSKNASESKDKQNEQVRKQNELMRKQIEQKNLKIKQNQLLLKQNQILIQQLKTNIQTKDNTIGQFNQKIDQLKIKNNQFENTLKNKEQELLIINQNSLPSSKKQLEILKAQLTTFKQKYNKLTNENNFLKQQIELRKKRSQKKIFELHQNQNLIKKIAQNQIKQNSLNDQILKLNKQLQLVQQKQKQLLNQNEMLKQTKINQSLINLKSTKNKNEQSLPKQKQHEVKSPVQIQLQSQIQNIVQFYTKQIISLKNQLKQSKQEKTSLQKEIHNKQKQIRQLNKLNKQQITQIQNLRINSAKNTNNPINKQNNIQNLNQKTFTINQKQKQTDKKTIFKPTQNEPQLKRQNSMSDFLKTHSKYQINVTQQINPNNIHSNIRPQIEIQKSKYFLLGKTQNSLQKMSKIKRRNSGGNSLHLTRGQYHTQSHSRLLQNKNYQINYLNNSHKNILKKQVPQSSHNNLFVMNKNQTKNVHLYKKSSVLNLLKNSEAQINANKLQTMIPFIENYFKLSANMSLKDISVFKDLCLFPQEKNKKPFSMNQFIEVRCSDSSSNGQVYILSVRNISNISLKLKILSCHDEFKILGQKSRYLKPNASAQYQIQTKVKDLNLRFPIISLIINQDSNLKNRIVNFTQSLHLPLTLLQFTQFYDQIPNFVQIFRQQTKIYKSQSFYLNKDYVSLRECFAGLNFKKAYGVNNRQKQVEYSWTGTLRHKFIQNIEVCVQISQKQNIINFQFKFRQFDQISQNYSKVMIQVLKFLLQ